MSPISVRWHRRADGSAHSSQTVIPADQASALTQTAMYWKRQELRDLGHYELCHTIQKGRHQACNQLKPAIDGVW